MDLKKYDELRKKISTKDFEGNNRGLDKWLWRFSFVGNASSIFFAYFLVYPALLKAITLNFVTGNWGMILAFILSIIFLVIFEITKRYLIKNFSNDYMVNKRNLSVKILGWSLTSIAVIGLSFYLSISGSKNLAQTSTKKNVLVENQVTSLIDSLTLVYDAKKQIYADDNEALRKVSNELRQILAETPINYMTARKEYQKSIDKNTEIIQENDAKIATLNMELQTKIDAYNNKLNAAKNGNKSEDDKNILLFVVIVIFNELIIIGGLYFREYFEYTLYQLNQQKFEKIYQKKDRYLIITKFIYNNGNANIGDNVIGGLELKKIISEKTNMQNKFVDEYLYEMDSLGIFNVNGKRRYINKRYDDAIDIISNYENILDVFDEFK